MNSLSAFFNYPHRSNGTKTLLDATLLNTAKYLKFDSNSHLLFSAYISVKNYICAINDSVGLMFNKTFPVMDKLIQV